MHRYCSFAPPPLAGCRGSGVPYETERAEWVCSENACQDQLITLWNFGYIYYRHASTQDRSSIGDIELYVIDITLIS
jgi:hypothetical protein